MKVYRIGFMDDMQEHKGYAYATSKADAGKLRHELRRNGYTIRGTESRDVPLTKAGVLAALEAFGSHPDNG